MTAYPTGKEDAVTHSRPHATGIIVGMATATLVLAGLAIATRPAWADDAQDARQLVDRARLTLQSFLEDPQVGPNLRALVRNAKGVLIYPQVLRGAFLFGASGGRGVFLARNGESGTWAGPVFCSIGEASVGLQAGAEASQVVLVVRTDQGVRALLSQRAKLGADASVAAGPVGVGVQAGTVDPSTDLVSYSRNQGLYAGLSLGGAIVGPQDNLDQAYYGRPVTPAQILIQREVSNGQARGLIAEVARVAGGSSTTRRAAARAR